MCVVVVDVFSCCSSRACNVTCDTCTPTRSVYIPKSKLNVCKNWKLHAERSKKWHSHWNTQNAKLQNEQIERKNAVFALTHGEDLSQAFSFPFLLPHSMFRRYHELFIPMVRWPISFIVECVRWAYQAEWVGFSNRHSWAYSKMWAYKNEMHMCMCVCVSAY